MAKLREITAQRGIVLIFDEVVTGFRVSKGGAQAHYGVTPDLTTMGKIIGGGMPVGAVGGPAGIMDHLSPLGAVYQAGTLSGNPAAMSAGLATLEAVRAGQPRLGVPPADAERFYTEKVERQSQQLALDFFERRGRIQEYLSQLSR